MRAIKFRAVVVAVMAVAWLATPAVMADPIMNISVTNSRGDSYTLEDDALDEDVDAYNGESIGDRFWGDIPATPDLNLVGDDYVKTSDIDRQTTEEMDGLEVDVTVDTSESPVSVYVFHSDELADPDWLTSDFTQLTENLTLDNSKTFSIYEQTVSGGATSTVTTFDNEGAPNATMYGIAAQPVPEPASIGLLGAAGVGLFGLRRRRC